MREPFFYDAEGLGGAFWAYWHKSRYDRRFYWVDYLEYGHRAVMDDYGTLVDI